MVLLKYKEELKKLNVEIDFIKRNFAYDGKMYCVRIEGDLLDNGRYRWKLVMSYEINYGLA